MPKIPLYNQGQGGTVKTATGALSPRANVGAFTAPGQAQAAFFQKAGQVAFQFGMAEKQAETDKAKRDITTLVNQEMNNWTNENQDTTVEGYQASAQAKKQQLQTSALETLRGSLTRRQFAEVSGAFDSTFATKLAQGSQIAFAKNQKIRTESADNYLDGMYSELVSLNPSSDLYQQKLAEVNSQYDAFIGQGITPTKYGNRAAFAQTLDAGIFGKSVESASTQAQIDELREQTSQKVGDLSPAVFSARNKALDAQENVIQADITEAVFTELVELRDKDLGDAKVLEQDIESIRSKDGFIDYVDDDGNERTVKFSELTATSREMLISKLQTRHNNLNARNQNAMMLGLDSILYDQDTTLSDIVRLEEQLSTLTGRFAGIDDIGEINQARSAINAAKTNIARKELTNALEMQRDLIASISSKKGEEAEQLSKEDEANLAAITSVMNMAGREDLAFQLETSVQVEQQATKIFNGIQFGSKDTVTSALNKASQNVDTNVGKLVYEKLQAKVAARDKEMQNDFVGYYIKERDLTGKRPEDMPTATQLITIQRNMGIPELDIRVASNNQMLAFKDAYAQAETYQEKAAEGAKFLNSFGIHQDRVMRHLMKTGTITLVDNLIMAYPTDVGMKAVSIFNEAEQIKRYKGEIPKDQRDVVFGVVTDLIGDYSSSVIGGITNDVLGGGVTSGRASHVFAMRDIITNTAQGYILAGETDPEKAAELAYNNVMGNHFEFTKLGNDSTSSIRFEKGAYQYPQEMTDVLNISLTMNEDYLRSIVSPPPPRQGASPQEAIEQENRYFRELGQYGSWRTTTDNKSVYLVDQLGNVVTRKNAEGQSAFITVPLDKVSVLGTEFAKMGTVGEESYVSSISGRRNAMLEKLLTGQLF